MTLLVKAYHPQQTKKEGTKFDIRSNPAQVRDRLPTRYSLDDLADSRESSAEGGIWSLSLRGVYLYTNSTVAVQNVPAHSTRFHVILCHSHVTSCNTCDFHWNVPEVPLMFHDVP